MVSAAPPRDATRVNRMPPSLEKIDHIHIHVADRTAAEAWYREVLGLHRLPELVFWASDGGPLTVANAAGSVHLALFERARESNRSVIAFSVGADEFIAWQLHLQRALGAAPTLEDHTLSWSMYFSDPDGNPYEITSYEYEPLARRLGRADRIHA
jgi:catechol-2,3-dioxygenase